MSIDSRLERAARFLVEGHAARERFGPFPADAAPASVEEAYAVQDEFVALKSRVRAADYGRLIVEFEFAAQQGIARINGLIVGQGHGRDVMGHPFEALAWVANHLAIE